MRVIQHGVKMRAVSFGNGDWADELIDLDQPLSIAFRPVINEFGGRRSVEMQIVDWQVTEPAAVAAGS